MLSLAQKCTSAKLLLAALFLSMLAGLLPGISTQTLPFHAADIVATDESSTACDEGDLRTEIVCCGATDCTAQSIALPDSVGLGDAILATIPKPRLTTVDPVVDCEHLAFEPPRGAA